MIGRREFLRKTLATTGAALAARSLSPFCWVQSSGFDSRIEVLSREPLGVISPNLYGHFTENLSGVVYDGIWVGANSKLRSCAFPGVFRGQLRLARRYWSG